MKHNTYINPCRKKALILFISFISLKENTLWSVKPVSLKNSFCHIILLLDNDIAAAVTHEHCKRTLSEGLRQPVLGEGPSMTFKTGSKMSRVKERCPQVRNRRKFLKHSNQTIALT